MEITNETRKYILQKIVEYTVTDKQGNKIPKRMYYYELEQWFDPHMLKSFCDILQEEGLITQVDFAAGLKYPRREPTDPIQVGMVQDISLGLLTEKGQRFLDTF